MTFMISHADPMEWFATLHVRGLYLGIEKNHSERQGCRCIV